MKTLSERRRAQIDRIRRACQPREVILSCRVSRDRFAMFTTVTGKGRHWRVCLAQIPEGDQTDEIFYDRGDAVARWEQVRGQSWQAWNH